jgi:hypothetical protein
LAYSARQCLVARLLGDAAERDVAGGAPVAGEGAGGIELRQAVDADRQAPAVGGVEVVDEFTERPPCGQRLALARPARPIDGAGGELLGGEPDALIGAVTGELIETVGQVRQTVGCVGLPEPVGRNFGQIAETLFALAALFDYEFVVLKSVVERGVGNDEHFLLMQRTRTKRHTPRRFGRRQADTGLEPLPVEIDQRNKSGRHVEGFRNDFRQIVETWLRVRVEYGELPQREKTSHFRIGQRFGVNDRVILQWVDFCHLRFADLVQVGASALASECRATGLGFG